MKKWKTKAGLQAVMLECMDHLCGYVEVPVEHPFFGKNYKEEIESLKQAARVANEGPIGKRGILSVFCMAAKGGITPSLEGVINVHGSLTFSGNLRGYDGWYFGFDCAHAGDTRSNCNEEFVAAECESLAQQLVDLSR